MRPPHIATTKGKNVRMPTAVQTDSAAQQQAHASSTPVTTAVSEAAQTDSAVRTTAAPTTSTTPPTTQSVPTPTVVTKGVVIQEAKSSVQSKPTDSAAFKDKGKAVMVEPEKPLKKKAQIRVDEELARKLQEEEEDKRTLAQLMETKSQLQRDEELARRLHAKELAELAKEKAAQRNKQLRAQKMTKTPSPAQAKRDQRRRMTNFLKNALGWPAQRFQRMSDARLTELYKKEKQLLEEEAEEETQQETQKETAQEETHQAQEGVVTKNKETVPAQRGIKRRKMIASKPAKRLKRIKDAEQGKETQKEEGDKGKEAESSSVPSFEGILISTEAQFVDATPLQSKPPQIVDWFVENEDLKSVYKFVRADKSFFTGITFHSAIKNISRDDLVDIIQVGLNKYGVNQVDDFKKIDDVLIRIAMESIHVLMDTDQGQTLRARSIEGAKLRKWELFENCAVYSIMFTDGKMEYYFVEKTYAHTLVDLLQMQKVKLQVSGPSIMAFNLIEKIKAQIAVEQQRSQ